MERFDSRSPPSTWMALCVLGLIGGDGGMGMGGWGGSGLGWGGWGWKVGVGVRGWGWGWGCGNWRVEFEGWGLRVEG